jgi:NTE family protein
MVKASLPLGMTAFVLSGGANRGSVQAGMLEALRDAGIRPDLLVGESIGTATAAFLAADPSPEQARRLSALWRRVQPDDVFPINPLRMARALVHGTGLFPTTGLRRLLERELPYQTIQQAAVPLRIVATRLEDGTAAVFDAGPVVDAVLASAALPGIFPPHRVDGHLYVDGGLAGHAPLTPALQAGAETVYLLSVGFPCPAPSAPSSTRAVLLHSIGLLLAQRYRFEEPCLPAHHPKPRIIQLPTVCSNAGLRDFSHTAELIRAARAQTARFLAGQGTLPGCGPAPPEPGRLAS